MERVAAMYTGDCAACCTLPDHSFYCFFFFNDTATTEIYTLSLHDALPISQRGARCHHGPRARRGRLRRIGRRERRSEEHTPELQSPCNLVCRLLLEKKKINTTSTSSTDNTTQLPH